MVNTKNDVIWNPEPDTNHSSQEWFYEGELSLEWKKLDGMYKKILSYGTFLMYAYASKSDSRDKCFNIQSHTNDRGATA